ncbi:MAG: hypothetical protein A2Z20_09395 [Bdellovibrionales bacterium RBG_16_40_8]|nr:MAG: hypothetical protein A2Z20_09395 [Bdellovibrionales bacterium RBG_16_40_8]
MTRKIISLFVLSLLGSLIFYTPKLHAQSIHGILRVVKGDVRVIQNSSSQETKAKIGQKVFAKDTIIAGKDSRAKIVMVDNNELNVSPDTRIQIQNYEYKPSEDKKNVLLNVLYGKVRAKVNQKYDGDNTFQVTTPSAVAGVRGTDFFTSFDKKTHETKVVTFEGRVAFGQPGPNGQILNSVMVNMGQTSAVIGSATPDKPADVPKNELTHMEKQSDATKAADTPDFDKRKPAESDKEKKETAKDDKKQASSERKEINAGTAAPARMPTAIGGGSMLLTGDLAGAPNASMPPILPVMGSLPIGPAPVPNVLLPPKNDFIHEIVNTKRKLIINTCITGHTNCP